MRQEYNKNPIYRVLYLFIGFYRFVRTVFKTQEDLDLYRDAYSPQWDDDDEPIPSLALAPKNVEEVQAIVKIANEFKIPLFPISTGKNLGYGSSAPQQRGQVVVDLKRMNKIIEVDDKRNFCIVEPGVSYFDLYKYVEKTISMFF
ncbi:TPA: FAD-dependent oxidoreductase [Campylobacter coli]|nr:FAD-dependent oxidoreductase [Campylobacter coli]